MIYVQTICLWRINWKWRKKRDFNRLAFVLELQIQQIFLRHCKLATKALLGFETMTTYYLLLVRVFLVPFESINVIQFKSENVSFKINLGVFFFFICINQKYNILGFQKMYQNKTIATWYSIRSKICHIYKRKFSQKDCYF